MSTRKVHLPEKLLSMMARGVSVIVGSRDASFRPSVMRAVGSDIDADGSIVTVYLSRRQSRQLLQDIAATGHIAVVFSEPSTHTTVQLKASHAVARNAGPEDQPVLDRYLASMQREVELVGFAPHFTRAMLTQQLDDLVVVSFVPEAGFDQTPGPRAGAALGGRA